MDPAQTQFHTHDHRTTGSIRRLKLALALTFLYMLAELAGGWLTNSLALLADAGHMFTDVGALTLTLFAFVFASRPATSRKTFGFYRFEILAAFVNGLALVLLSLWIVYEAVERLRSATPVLGLEMTLIAAGGLAVNIVAAYLLHSGHRHNLNMRGAYLHILGDMLGSIAAISAGLAILAFGWFWADALCSILISAVIIVNAWRLIVESVNILLEGTPGHIDLTAVEAAILETTGVEGVHDLHIWTISSGMEALSAHITHEASVGHSELLARVRAKLHDEFGIDHLTIQMESTGRETEAIYVCRTGTKCFERAANNEKQGAAGAQR